MLSTVLEKIGNAFKTVLGTSNERLLRDMVPLVDRINTLEPEFHRKTDTEIRQLTDRLRKRLRGPKTYEEKQEILDDVLPQAFANVREAARRVLVTPAEDSPYPTMRPFDVQLIGAVALHRGMIAEMVTGEGKTLVATFAVYLNALAGDGVHIVTFNDYLAQRDADWMRPVYNLLGMTAGAIRSGQSPEEKREAYGCDVTYGSNSEFGFDYLRDNMAYTPEAQVQLTRGLNYAIVDEVDSILIDEARTPLIISGPVMRQPEKYYKANNIARSLKPGEDYIIKEKEETCHLTDEGIGRAERMLNVESLYSEANMDWPHYIETALRAHRFFERGADYIVKDGEVVIVDEFTGRLMEGRVWGDGLHQAVTVKEGLKLREETQTVATITYQNFFRLYNKLAGMTGTAMTEAPEFHKIYDLPVVAIPTNLPLIRKEHPDMVFRTQDEKWKAVAEEVEEKHEEGRPVLVGTTSIEKSEVLSDRLRRRGVEHEVLNAKPEVAAREAEIVAKAGQSGNVTIATNMAGRGTDIVLGSGVAARGGLHIVGTERHEARRIDNQLRGRAGRQGDPGSSRFFVSFEDELMRIFAPEGMRNWLAKVGMEEGMAIESKMVSRYIEKAQKRVEEYNFDIRKGLLEYDEVMDKQRKSIYSWRQGFVQNREVEQEALALLEDAVRDGVATYLELAQNCDKAVNVARSLTAGEEYTVDEEAQTCGLTEDGVARAERMLGLSSLDSETNRHWLRYIESALRAHWFSEKAVERLREELVRDLRDWFEQKFGERPEPLHWDELLSGRVEEQFVEQARELFEQRCRELGRERLLDFARALALRTIDMKWKDHLYAMDSLKSGIGLRGYAQVDPKLEYKSEGGAMFEKMLVSIADNFTDLLFRVEVEERTGREVSDVWQISESRHDEFDVGQYARQQEQTAQNGGEKTVTKPIRVDQKVGRNDPCPCGSGKKYKHCCGRHG